MKNENLILGLLMVKSQRLEQVITQWQLITLHKALNSVQGVA